MNKTTLPHSNVQISPITFGAWAIGGWFWGGAEEKSSVLAVETAIGLGMTSIDTAPVYGFGQSEEFVAKAIKGKRSQVQILTKFGLVWDTQTPHLHYENTTDNEGNPVSLYRSGRKESVIQECENSLRRLGTDYIDLFQQHWPDDHTPIDETMEALDILKTQGKIRAGGVSNFSVAQMQEAEKHFSLSSNQVPYSMVFRDIEKELVPYSMENEKAIIAYSPLQRGLLTGKIRSGYSFQEGDHRPGTPFFKEPNLSRVNEFLDKIRPIAEGKGASLSQLVIQWTMQRPGISCVLVGARNSEQVQQNFMAGEVKLDKDEIETINSHLDKLELNL